MRGRVLASVAAAAPVAAAVAAAEVKMLNDIANDADREAYSKAYKMIGRLMAGGMAWPKARAKVQQETGWTVCRTSAFKSKRARGKVVPTPQGRPLYMGEEAEKTMVRSVQALRSMRLPARKHIVINMATNMVKSAGLGMALDKTTGKGRTRHRASRARIRNMASARFRAISALRRPRCRSRVRSLAVGLCAQSTTCA